MLTFKYTKTIAKPHFNLQSMVSVLFSSFFKLNEMQMNQVMKHQDVGLLNMIRRTDLQFS